VEDQSELMNYLGSEMRITDNIRLALRSMAGNKLRSGLTLGIIAIGIMALVGILTSVDAIKERLSSSLSILGGNSFSIVRKGTGLQVGHGRRKRKKLAPAITFEEALLFKEQYDFPAKTSISFRAAMMATISHKTKETTPSIFVKAIDENYLKVQELNIEHGRNFNENEIRAGNSVAIIGSKIASTLFKDHSTAAGEMISINNQKYQLIGILEDKGSSGITNTGNSCFVSLQNGRTRFNSAGSNYSVQVAVADASMLDTAISEATGTMRSVRKLKFSEESNFEMNRSDKLAAIFIDNLYYVEWAAIIIGLITLIGAAVGLMNIMLVTVAERTREIGVSKALGAKDRTILMQFLWESIAVCQLGGLLGIILGIIAGNVVSILIQGPFIIPWAWMIGGIIFCLFVGIIAGIYPAIKASRLDPIESLRYE